MLEIWLKASIKAHDFVEPSFWETHVETMRNVYIPASETYVYVKDATVIGFYSLCDDNLAAIFVAPECQGRGVGKELLDDAKRRRRVLTLSVYKENTASCQFYLEQGFSIIREQVDEHTGHLEYIMRTGV